jgi:hypothetical protein
VAGFEDELTAGGGDLRGVVAVFASVIGALPEGLAVAAQRSQVRRLNLIGLRPGTNRVKGAVCRLWRSIGLKRLANTRQPHLVFGTLLRRRREYITVRALGLLMCDLVALVVGEAALVAVASVVLGGIIGTAMALLFVQILRPLFTIPPTGVTVPAVGVTLLMGLVLAAALAAGASLRRTHLVDVLREE